MKIHHSKGMKQAHACMLLDVSNGAMTNLVQVLAEVTADSKQPYAAKLIENLI